MGTYELIDALTAKYEKGDTLSQWRSDENGEYNFAEEVEELLRGRDLAYNVDEMGCFDSPGYACGVITYSWYENGCVHGDIFFYEIT